MFSFLYNSISSLIKFLNFQNFDEYFACLNVSCVTLPFKDHTPIALKINHVLIFFLYGYVKEPEDVETKRQAQSGEFPTHNLSPLDTDYNRCLGNKNREEHAVSAEYMESLILLASKSNSSHSSEEEMVDITEPRFESFCMTNGTVT